MTDRKRRIEQLERRQRPTTILPAFIMAESREDADRQLQEAAIQPLGTGQTIFVMLMGGAG
jgi:hypothetical protein